MQLLLLPDDELYEIFSFLDNQSLYNCLFVNRYFCNISIPILWKKPFNSDQYKPPKSSSVINTLLACLNEDEISSLIPYKISFSHWLPLFEYGKFVRIIDHASCVDNIVDWLKPLEPTEDCRVQKLVNVIYQTIMRQGSNLRELRFSGYHYHQNSYQDYYIDLPKFTIFTTYIPGITNLECLRMDLNEADDMKLPNTLEFLSMVSTFCCNIVKYDLNTTDLGSNFAKKLLDIIKSQPLKKMNIYNDDKNEIIKKVINSLKLRSETLKELLFLGINFQNIDLSFVPRFKYLERLEFTDCSGFTHKLCNILSKKEFHLKQFKLLRGSSFGDHVVSENPDVLNAMICSLVDKSLRELSFSNFTLETIKVIKELCPNISSLHVRFFSAHVRESRLIQHICTFPSLKILNIEDNNDCNASTLTKALGEYLPTSVEYISLDFYMNLSSFEYFINNCKANLKRLLIRNFRYVRNDELTNDYLLCVDKYQEIHNSLKVFGVDEGEYGWTEDQLETINSIKNKGVDVVPIRESIGLFYYCKYTQVLA
jgi:hypothetical protein